MIKRFWKNDDGSRFGLSMILQFFSLYEILEQKKVKVSASKANKDCQILLFDVHVICRIPKASFPRCISEDDGKQMVSLLHSIVQLLYLVINSVVLWGF